MAMAAAMFVLTFALSALAQEAEPGATEITAPHVPAAPGRLIIPASSMPQAIPAGHRFAAHTNVEILIPAGLKPDTPPYSGYGYETPQSVACHYGLVTTTDAPGCDPNTATVTPTGGSKTIAIVDAYDDPLATLDLTVFSEQFGLPLPGSNFKVVWANSANSSCPVNYGFGVPEDPTGGWEFEESLDIEWSHAMAPSAKIYLVEACSSYDSDLQQAVLVANNLVRCGLTEINPSTGALGTCPTSSTGRGEVSMSWGSGEFAAQTTSDSCANLDDSCFTAPGVVYLAATGDSPGVEWPSTSPNVVAAGGTTLRRNPTSFAFMQETAWVVAGGGQSFYETRPAYQSSVSTITGNSRGVPDLSFVSDPNTGLWVRDTNNYENEINYGWWIAGGTSAAAPSLAAIINNAASRSGVFAGSSSAELGTIYTDKAILADYTDITLDYCGLYMGTSTRTGYDLCTGVGVVRGYLGK